MGVGSHLELYTTMFGWMIYGHLWKVIITTGIVGLPFMMMIIEDWKQSYETTNDSPPVETSLKRLEVHVYTAMVVLMIACAPFWPLKATVLSYTPPSTPNNPDPNPIKRASNNSSYSSTPMAQINEVKVPLIWALTMSATSGINHLAIDNAPTVENIRSAKAYLGAIKLSDPELAHELSLFTTYCFQPSRAKYKTGAHSPYYDEQVKVVLEKYGVRDPEWVGSHLYQDIEGLYKFCTDPKNCGSEFRAKKPIKGWPYEASRDAILLDNPEATPPKWGNPICLEWWRDDTKGLRERIYADATLLDKSSAVVQGDGAKNSFRDTPIDKLAKLWKLSTTDDAFKDAVVQRILNNSSYSIIPNDYAFAANSQVYGEEGRDSFTKSLMYGIKSVFGGVGTAYEAVSFSVKLNVLLQAMVMIQAVLLMTVYMFLGFMMVAARYTVQGIVVGVLVIFTIKFWSVLWAYAWFIDQNLILAMYPDESSYFEFFSGGGGGTKRMLLDMLTSSLYILLPTIFTVLMTAVGVQTMANVNKGSSSMGSKSGTDGAADKGGSTAKSTADKGGKYTWNK